MKISVLIPAHDSAAWLARTLESLHVQTHSNWELLVVAYGAADASRALVRAFGQRIGRPVVHLHLGENHGSASARNRLLEMATGEVMTFLDPPDHWAPHHLENAAAQMGPEADIVASDVRVEGSGAPVSHLSFSAHLNLNATRLLFTHNALPCASAVAFRRELITRVGVFDTQFRGGECRDFWLRCALAGARFHGTHSPTCRMVRTGPPTPTQSLQQAEQQVQFYEKHRDLAAVPAAMRRHLLSMVLASKGRLLRASDPEGAAQHFRQAWALQPMYVQTLGQLALLTPRGDSPEDSSAPTLPAAQ